MFYSEKIHMVIEDYEIYETLNYFRYLRIPLFRSKKKLNVLNKQRFRNIEFRISQFVCTRRI